MLFNLQKFFVKREDFRRSPGPGRGKAAFGVGQNFFEVSGRPHRNLNEKDVILSGAEESRMSLGSNSA